jgi:hypothetical protein
VKIDARFLVRLYPRAWRERYGEELLLMLDDRVGLGDVVDVIFGATNEWVIVMTGVNRWNDQAQRTTAALAQAAACVIVFQTVVPSIVSAISGHPVNGAPHLWQALLVGFVSSLLQSAVTLGPVAVASAITPWHQLPHARLSAGLCGALIAFRIASHLAWGPTELALVAAGSWIAYKTADTPQDLHASMVN